MVFALLSSSVGRAIILSTAVFMSSSIPFSRMTGSFPPRVTRTIAAARQESKTAILTTRRLLMLSPRKEVAVASNMRVRHGGSVAENDRPRTATMTRCLSDRSTVA
eukprot:266236-Hanusia_phi.AAC.8